MTAPSAAQRASGDIAPTLADLTDTVLFGVLEAVLADYRRTS